MKTIATIEARMASSRLPGKVLADLNGQPMLGRLIERVARATVLDEIVIATTTDPQDDAIEALAGRLRVWCYRGGMEDVLGRVVGACRMAEADEVVPLTGDNPLVDPALIDDVVAFFRIGRYDYVTTTHMHHSRRWGAERTFPVGVSVQVVAVKTLAEVADATTDPVDREHTTFYVYNHPDRYKLGAFLAEGAYAEWRHPELRFTVDTAEDLALTRRVFGALSPRDPRFSTLEAIRLVSRNEELKNMNAHVRQRIASEQQTHG